MKDIIPKMNYDDFYKFITSFSIIIFILSVVADSILMQNYTKLKDNAIFWPAFWMYAVFAAIAAILFGWATAKWKSNQDKLDLKLNAEVAIKILEARKKAVEYQNDIDELAKGDITSLRFDIFKNLQKHYENKAEEKHKK